MLMKTFYVSLKREIEQWKEMFLKHPKFYKFAFLRVKMGPTAIKWFIFRVPVFSPYNRPKYWFHPRVLDVCRAVSGATGLPLHSLSASVMSAFTEVPLKPRANSATTDNKNT